MNRILRLAKTRDVGDFDKKIQINRVDMVCGEMRMTTEFKYRYSRDRLLHMRHAYILHGENETKMFNMCLLSGGVDRAPHTISRM